MAIYMRPCKMGAWDTRSEHTVCIWHGGSVYLRHESHAGANGAWRRRNMFYKAACLMAELQKHYRCC